MVYGSGYDHCFVLKEKNSDKLLHAGTLYEEKTGRKLDVYTTEPGL